MRKEFKIFVMVLITLLFISCGRKVTYEEAREKISQHMYERYKEEFEVNFVRKNGYTKGKKDVIWYEACVTPLSYIGTPKQGDSYYHAIGTVMVRKKTFREELDITRDTYSNVLLKELANKFYGKKLEELFGENYLSVLEVTGRYSDKSKTFEGSVNLTKKEGMNLYIEGGIYIFGRVENDEDREWYRKQIYEFIQFMKETGTFEYVAIAINILDDRVLSKKIQENEELKQELITIGKELDKSDHELFRIKRRELIKKLPLKLKQEVKMEEINKTEIRNSVKWSHYNNLLSLPLYSEKYIKANSLQDTRRISKFEKINDVQFTYEDY
ncbi:hypothetical protein M2102_001892 [Fusobacterium sp. PH5-7]|uniref:hypothetical protein n=1 Tax=Fusobacterium sp. PH5-7 TaxID=2940528 RepID=UPI0024736537|nr:hypothetical protein [Fusobacterium sp. PH5-7]MDH6458257.1 hypothetical protein [Fusobacterium sp. PH5-7]